MLIDSKKTKNTKLKTSVHQKPYLTEVDKAQNIHND